MSTVEATTTPAPVEEVKPTETVPATESSAPAAEAPKVEDVVVTVRFLCFFVSFLFLLHFFFHKEAKKAEATQVGLLPFLLCLCSCMHFFFFLLTGR